MVALDHVTTLVLAWGFLIVLGLIVVGWVIFLGWSLLGWFLGWNAEPSVNTRTGETYTALLTVQGAIAFVICALASVLLFVFESDLGWRRGVAWPGGRSAGHAFVGLWHHLTHAFAIGDGRSFFLIPLNFVLIGLAGWLVGGPLWKFIHWRGRGHRSPQLRRLARAVRPRRS